MAAFTKKTWLEKTGQVTTALGAIAGVCLLAMVTIIFVAVIARYVFGHAILGVNEVVQLAAVALVMLSLPYCTQAQEHVRVDIFDRVLGRRGRLFGDLLSRTLSIIALSVLVKRSWGKVLDAIEYGDATNMLSLPLWPFFALIVLGMSLCILVFALQMIALVITRGREAA
ncbi:TRAP transporter small permease [Actibacterium lipolyticum]|uniref:TRAP transporter small permease protein n=1 Tax=Actibacterium lipolyticum TaxID=1524263 RepID=A0A238L8E2_9RHOB|nr:TRAP transporter small permease [Actibacterium lipolyticum]SMX51259.1 2,3-diketo-L-gulonate TRAP transporter small permease protein YiaM [Actibacterium lipolyticum]